MRNIFVSILGVLILANVIIGAVLYLQEARADDSPPPPPPASVTVTAEPGTTNLAAVWPAVAGADSYRVRWRPHGESFADGDEVVTTAGRASFTVSSQGLWVVHVKACNEAGCSRPAATVTAAVIINTAENPAVRVWVTENDDDDNNNGQADSEDTADDYTVEIDWDDLPGHYVVKYRSEGDEEFTTSPALSDSRYSIPLGDFTDNPIIRVFFNCNETGERCVHLGRHPNINFAPPAPPSIPQGGPFPPPPGSSESNAVGQSTAPESGSWEECIERPAKNDWERALYGETVRTCYRGTLSGPQPMPEDGSDDAGGQSNEFECMTYTHETVEDFLIRTFSVRVDIYWCYNNVDRIKYARVSGGRATDPTLFGGPTLIEPTRLCGWVEGRSPSSPYTYTGRYYNSFHDETLPYLFSGFIQAMYGNRNYVGLIEPCQLTRFYLASGAWVAWDGSMGDWR